MLSEELKGRIPEKGGRFVTCHPDFSILHLSTKDGKFILITPPEFRFQREIASIFGKKTGFFPPLRDELYSSLPPSRYALSQRVKTMWRAIKGLDDIIVAPVNALLPLPSPSWVEAQTFPLHKGESFDMELLIEHLRDLEYRERDFVKEIGEYSVRGGILDVFTGWEELPTRIEFSGDEIISIRSFDPGSQLSIETKNEVIIGPYREYSLKNAEELLEKMMNEVSREESYGLKRIMEEFKKGEPGELPIILKREGIPALEFFSDFTPALFNLTEINTYLNREEERRKASYIPYPSLNELISLPSSPFLEYCCQDGELVEFHSLESFKGGISAWEKWLKSEKSSGKKIIFVGNIDEKPSFADASVKGELRTGFQLEDLIVLGRNNLPGREIEAPKKIRKLRKEIFKLEEGKPVVHEDYGIGIFKGLIRYSGEIEGDFLAVEYDRGEKLYVPVENAYKLHPYNVPEGYTVKLDRLSSPRWNKLKERVKRQVQKIVESMVELYAERKAKRGHSYSYDRMLDEFIADFEFEETEDQSKAWDEVRTDMEREYPMDRLLVGDVGFGKTEIAMRAAFLAVLNGKQVAVLAPTTVLALQHYKNFLRRFRNYAVEIALLSRLTPSSDEKRIIEGLKRGRIDIVIGTHRLLSEDVGFKDLGLLIIDEEQRFGVKHKEKLREMKKEVDSLTMTATPIPRTLSLALFSVWDLSIIQTPPPGRKAVETFVMPFREAVFKEAISKELQREGQVYIVLNRIEELEYYRQKLEKMFPSVPVLILHGRMRPSTIEKGIIEFMEGKYPILLTTTIIENGIDIPNVNTLIVLKAENLGLAQLHQLRGRVGRSYRKAYAYFFTMAHTLEGKAAQRLRAIREFASLGSGFQLSLEDMNIRGAGTLLGTAQHGHIAELGMDYYLKILQDTIAKVKGERREVELKLGLNITIPDDFIKNPEERINYYRLITSAEDEEELKKIQEEITDKYGKIPDRMKNVFLMGRILILAKKIGASTLQRRGEEIFISFQNPPDPALLYPVVEKEGGRFEPEGIVLPVKPEVNSILNKLERLYEAIL